MDKGSIKEKLGNLNFWLGLSFLLMVLWFFFGGKIVYWTYPWIFVNVIISVSVMGLAIWNLKKKSSNKRFTWVALVSSAILLLLLIGMLVLFFYFEINTECSEYNWSPDSNWSCVECGEKYLAEIIGRPLPLIADPNKTYEEYLDTICN